MADAKARGWQAPLRERIMGSRVGISRGAKPLKAEVKRVVDFGRSIETANLHYSLYFAPSLNCENEGYSDVAAA